METHNMDTTPAVCTIVTVLVFLPITMSHGALQEQILGEGSEWETVYEQWDVYEQCAKFLVDSQK